MAACERCWAIYSLRQRSEPDLCYADVVADEERRNGGPCSPREQCGGIHLVLDWKDGGRRCRCGEVVEREPAHD